MKRLAEVFAEEPQKLERQWDRREDVSTEDVRLALRRYRASFERLLAVYSAPPGFVAPASCRRRSSEERGSRRSRTPAPQCPPVF